jgi:segregation and condensation protein A
MKDISAPGEAAGDPFEDPERPRENLLVIDVAGFEGPLDLLLKLAREQKVDLAKISIRALAEQYLAFIEAARSLRLELAADYLVMAAWLAFLKSKLLLPEVKADTDEPSGDELAAILAQRLVHLEAIRGAGQRLMARSRLGVHVFPRGMPESIAVTATTAWAASLYDLLSAYAALRLRNTARTMQVRQRRVLSLQEARERLMRLIGQGVNWAPLDSYLVEYLAESELRRTARASALSASLELVREGEIELRQTAAFAPLYVRRRLANGAALAEAVNG